MVHAKGGVLLAGALKFLPLYLLVFPGMAARVLYTDSVACSDPEACTKICGSPTGCSNLAYIELVLNLLPVGGFSAPRVGGSGLVNATDLLATSPPIYGHHRLLGNQKYCFNMLNIGSRILILNL